MAAIMVIRGWCRSVERKLVHISGIARSQQNLRYKVMSDDNHGKLTLLHTSFLSMDYVLKIHNILRGVMVL